MKVDFDVFGSKEVDLNPQKPKKQRRVDDYDYTDSFIEHFEGEDDVVEIEPHIGNFFIYKGTLPEKPSKVLLTHKGLEKKANRKENPARPLDSIYCMQNLVYKKIMSGEYADADVLDLLLYDLIINHDKDFKLLGKKLEESKAMKILCVEFINSSIGTLQTRMDDLFSKLEGALKSESSYQDMNLVFKDEVCESIFYYIDVKTKLSTYDSEVASNKKINYNAVRKSVYNEIYGILRKETRNQKQIGYYIYQYCRKHRVGKFNGFKAEYLCLEEGSESRFTETFDTFDSFGSLKGMSGTKNGSGGSKCEKDIDHHNLEEEKLNEPGEECKKSKEESRGKAEKSSRKEESILAGSENNSFSLQKVDTQWLETLSEHPGDDIDSKKC